MALLEQMPESSRTGEFMLLKARILASAGRDAEAQQLLTASAQWFTVRPQLVEEAALLLAGYGRYEEAGRALAQAIAEAPTNRTLLFSEVVVQALDGRTGEALKGLRHLEERWPEWDRPYLLHGMLLIAAQRAREAAPLLRTAAALSPPESAGAKCHSLRDWLSSGCRGVAQ